MDLMLDSLLALFKILKENSSDEFATMENEVIDGENYGILDLGFIIHPNSFVYF
jgi:hypothetical protein